MDQKRSEEGLRVLVGFRGERPQAGPPSITCQASKIKGEVIQAEIRSYAKKISVVSTKNLLLSFSFLLGVMMSGCSWLSPRSHPTMISPPPPLVTSVSGFISFRLKKEQELVRGRAFFVLVPGKGRIEIIDPVGRQAIIAAWDDGEEWLIIHAERVYWQGHEGEEKLMAVLLGFTLQPFELLGWIIGRAEGLELLAGEPKGGLPEQIIKKEALPKQESQAQKEGGRFFFGWEIERDQKGRLWQGKKADLKIRIEERSPDQQVAKRLSLAASSVSGYLTLLGLEFNRVIPDDNFRPEFIRERGFRLISWEELETLLRGHQD